MRPPADFVGEFVKAIEGSDPLDCLRVSTCARTLPDELPQLVLERIPHLLIERKTQSFFGEDVAEGSLPRGVVEEVLSSL